MFSIRNQVYTLLKDGKLVAYTILDQNTISQASSVMELLDNSDSTITIDNVTGCYK